MAIERAFVAVTSSATNGAQTLKNSLNVAEVNRDGIGVYHVHLTDDLPVINSIVRCAVDANLNAADATHRYIGYNVVGQRQIDVRIADEAGTAGLDIDFSLYVEADSDSSSGA